MSTTVTERHMITHQIADLLRDRPDHDTPTTARAAWLQRKAELLQAIEDTDS